MKTLSKLGILGLFLALITVYSCSDDNIINPQGGPPSDLTRSGKFLAFTSNLTGNQDIYLAQVNSLGQLETSGLVFASNPFDLTAVNTENDKQSNWSPNGRVLVYSQTQGNVQQIFAYFFSENGRVDSTLTTNPRQLVLSNGNWDNNPSFSPDGKYLIWDRRTDNAVPVGVDSADSRDIFIGDISGSGNTYAVTNIRAITTDAGLDEYNPKWSPKTSVRRVAYEYATSSTSSDHDVYIMDPLNATTNVNYYNPGRSGYPAWEPSCTKIIFESDQGNSGVYKIVVGSYPTAGTITDLVQNNTQNNRYPTWLPNGNLIAYINYATSNGSIYVIPSTGGVPVKLLPVTFDGANNLWPAW